jgi:N-acyl-D-aspartate/D-glutamate deacylase
MTFGVLPFRRVGLEQLDLLDSTAAAGGRMIGQTHCRGISIVLCFKAFLPFGRLPEWKAARARPLDEQRLLFEDPQARQALVHAAHHSQYARVAGAGGHSVDYDRILVFDDPNGPNRTVAAVAAERNMDPVDLMIELALASDFDQLFLQQVTRTDPAELLAMMKHPRTVMTFSDAGAHVSQIMDASIQTHLLRHWVFERQDLTLEEAVRMLTLEPALVWGFSDRGLLREGMIADLNVFDPARVAPAMPTVEHDLPGGATRLKQTSVGILATVVNGEITLDHGVPTGALPGSLLRRVPPR